MSNPIYLMIDLWAIQIKVDASAHSRWCLNNSIFICFVVELLLCALLTRTVISNVLSINLCPLALIVCAAETKSEHALPAWTKADDAVLMEEANIFPVRFGYFCIKITLFNADSMFDAEQMQKGFVWCYHFDFSVFTEDKAGCSANHIAPPTHSSKLMNPAIDIRWSYMLDRPCFVVINSTSFFLEAHGLGLNTVFSENKKITTRRTPSTPNNYCLCSYDTMLGGVEEPISEQM